MSAVQAAMSAALGRTVRKGPPCTVSVALRLLDPHEAAELETAVDENPPTVMADTFYQLFGPEAPAAHVIARHRRRECKCRARA